MKEKFPMSHRTMLLEMFDHAGIEHEDYVPIAFPKPEPDPESEALAERLGIGDDPSIPEPSPPVITPLLVRSLTLGQYDPIEIVFHFDDDGHLRSIE